MTKETPLTREELSTLTYESRLSQVKDTVEFDSILARMRAAALSGKYELEIINDSLPDEIRVVLQGLGYHVYTIFKQKDQLNPGEDRYANPLGIKISW